MAESRRAPRSHTKRQGKAVLNDRKAFSCTIRDLSTTGARLAFQHPMFLPRTFRLRFDAEDHPVKVVWRRGIYAGVRFETPLPDSQRKQKRRSWLW